eukprot:GILK01005376.1.p1 GENE.GILK01005376.1~~GILK01005376.1.p1  ORF type:complete len:298 (-),score=45.80 GILK01005376.1:524-1378(-)
MANVYDDFGEDLVLEVTASSKRNANALKALSTEDDLYGVPETLTSTNENEDDVIHSIAGLEHHSMDTTEGAVESVNDASSETVSKAKTASKSKSMVPPDVSVLDLDIETLPEKRWRNPGVDISDFFNYGFDETSWKNYVHRLKNKTDPVLEAPRPEWGNFGFPPFMEQPGFPPMPPPEMFRPEMWGPGPQDRNARSNRDRARDREEMERDNPRGRDRERDGEREREREREREEREFARMLSSFYFQTEQHHSWVQNRYGLLPGEIATATGCVLFRSVWLVVFEF